MRLRFILAVCTALLLASCATGQTDGAPGSVATRLNGQAGFYAGVGGGTLP